MLSVEPPPPPDAGAEVELEDDDDDDDDELLLDEPQPATASAAIAMHMRIGRFMRSTLPRSAEQELQQRLLRVQPVLGLIPDRRALAVQDPGADLLAGMGRQAVQRNGVVARLLEQR